MFRNALRKTTIAILVAALALVSSSAFASGIFVDPNGAQAQAQAK